MQGSLTCRKYYDMGPMAFLPLRRKSCYGFLSSLKIHRPRSDLNPGTLDPMANTLITRTSMATYMDYKYINKQMGYVLCTISYLEVGLTISNENLTEMENAYDSLECVVSKCYCIHDARTERRRGWSVLGMKRRDRGDAWRPLSYVTTKVSRLGVSMFSADDT
jgi:hypothetical protein